MQFSSHGFRVALPPRWEAAITVGPPDEALRFRAAERGRQLAEPPALHLANFPLPPERGDFGSGAVDVMGVDNAFIALVEYGPESLGTPLFSGRALPRRLRPEQFRTNSLQRAIPGQAGLQVFCTEAGRPLCLYVVLGSTRNARALVDEVSTVLAGLELT